MHTMIHVVFLSLAMGGKDRQGRQDRQDAEEKGGQEEEKGDQGDERDGPLVRSTT